MRVPAPAGCVLSVWCVPDLKWRESIEEPEKR